MTSGFGERVRAALTAYGPLCVGIDPHAVLLDQWGLAQDAAGVREFGLRVVAAAAGRVGAVKPQASFFERFGSAGIAALEDVMRAGRDAGLIVIADAKRGDIGTTMDAYAEAWLSAGAPLESDALTVSPYLGVGALEGTFELARQEGKGVFVLAATSNSEATALQQSRTAGGATVAGSVVAAVSEWNAAHTPSGHWGGVGFVIGATIDATTAGIDAVSPAAPILAPGFGAQGATPEQLLERFGGRAPQVLANESRSLLSSGPDRLAEVIEASAQRYREVLRG